MVAERAQELRNENAAVQILIQPGGTLAAVAAIPAAVGAALAARPILGRQRAELLRPLRLMGGLLRARGALLRPGLLLWLLR